MPQTYTTKEIADAVGVHGNTVRFYEDIGFLTKPARRPNGRRIYTALQLAQCRLIRTAMRAEVLQNGLRDKAVEIVRLCAALDFDAALAEAEVYRSMIRREIGSAKAAIASVERTLNAGVPAIGRERGRREAAAELSVTTETLRTWERSGLISVRRGNNGYCLYSDADMARLNIIRTLRLANYSLSAILRLLGRLDGHAPQSVEDILNTPGEAEDIVSVCDRLIASLQATAEDACTLEQMLREMREKFSNLQ